MRGHVPIVGSLWASYKLFYPYVGHKILFICVMTLFGGLSEGLGVTMFVPILNSEQGGGTNNKFVDWVLGWVRSGEGELSITTTLVLACSFFLLKFVFLYAQSAITAYLCTKIEKDLRDEFCKKYSLMEYEFYVETSVGYLNNIVTTEINRMVAGMRNYVLVLANLIIAGVYIGVAGVMDPFITLLVCLLLLFSWFVFKPFYKYLRWLSLQVSKTNAALQDLIIQAINNFKYLKATGSFSDILARIALRTDENRKYNLRNTLSVELYSIGMEPMAIIMVSCLIWYQMVQAGQAFGEVVVLMFFFHRSLIRAFTLQDCWQRFQAQIGGALTIDQAANVLDLHREKNGHIAVETVEEGIRLSKVCQRYGDRQVLTDVDMSFPKLSSIGIVGPSGAGKTTLFDMLAGLTLPASGTISINGHDYRDLARPTLRRLLGYVTQEPVIFNDTIANNIALWSCDPADSECRARIEEAARIAHCSEFIRECDEGLDAFVGDNGVKLSGGQRQRIAIAREVFKHPELLIFDEATSALDTESESIIQQSIARIKGSCTMVIIAHRLSTIRDCDVIYVLDKGRIVESGAFAELYEDESSLFSAMCKAQNI